MKMNSIIQVSSRQLMIPAACLMLSVQAFAQQAITVKGVVRDKAGMELIGASVAVKGSTKGVITDIDGRFSLKVAPGQILVVSFIGYETIEEPVRPGRTFLELSLHADDTQLSEVVVTGYQTISKERAAGSFSVITPEDMQGKLQTNILDRMEGMVAGLQHTPGSTPQIRGVSTLRGEKTPLYVVDGIPFEGDIEALNPSDIVNVTVLKDATAASIYGARSANGVIVITTKKGKKDKIRISYKGNVGIARPRLPESHVECRAGRPAGDPLRTQAQQCERHPDGAQLVQRGLYVAL